MKILAILPLYPPHSLVGSWLSTHQLLRHVAKTHDVQVGITRSRIRPYIFEGVDVSSIRFEPEILEAMRAAEVLITHAGDNGKAARLSRHLGVAHMRMVHGQETELDTADLVVFNAEATREAMDCPVPSIVVHPPVDPAEYRSDHIGEHVTIVNCTKPKGITTAWKAAELLPHRRFLGVRGHYGYQVIPRAANFRVIDAVADIRQVFARTRILLMPSEYETYGRVGVEAFASGIPVIAHPTPGLKEALGSAGIFIDRHNAEEWAEEIERLHNPADWEQASEQALDRSAELHPADDLDRFQEALESVDCLVAA